MLMALTVLILLLGAAWLCFHLVRAAVWEHTAEEKGRKVRPCLLVAAGTSVWLRELKQHPRGAWAWSWDVLEVNKGRSHLSTPFLPTQLHPLHHLRLVWLHGEGTQHSVLAGQQPTKYFASSRRWPPGTWGSCYLVKREWKKIRRWNCLKMCSQSETWMLCWRSVVSANLFILE